MASPRASSPIAEGGSPEPLTPRSKIKALLATVDSSDEETTPSRRASKKAPEPAKSTTQSNEVLPISEEEDDETEEDIRPRGRLASRMQGIAHPSKSPSKDEQGGEKNSTTCEVEMADAEDDDDDLPTAPRRLQRRAPRQSTPDGAAAPRSPSPGLFVSSPVRPSPTKSTHSNSDSDAELPSMKSGRFKALVERKRQERLAREAAEEARQAERRAAQEKLASELEQLDSDDGNVSSITDDEDGRRLTQEAKPTRKASRKAIEEMNRETQRMARSMQLAHEAKTRKKISKSSLFERFNYKPAGLQEPKVSSSSRPASPHSDVEMQDTPPSSPPVADKQDAQVPSETAQAQDDSLPASDDQAGSEKKTLDKGKGKAIDAMPEEQNKQPKRQVRVRLPLLSVKKVNLDSDDELEITATTKDKINAVFDNVPSKKSIETHSLQALKALAQLRSPKKETRRKAENHGMTVGELQTFLQQKARQQAKLERDRRLEMLKAQGIEVQTAEERERQMQEVEDLVAKAREEAQKIMQEERAAAKKEKKKSGEVDPLAWDDSEDEEYEDSANEADAEASAVELSGSEEEEDEMDEDEEAEMNPVFDEEAEDSGPEASAEDDEKMPDAVDGANEDVEQLPVTNKRRARKHNAVVSDDEDDEEIKATPRPKTAVHTSPMAPKTVSPAAPTSVLRSAKKTFIPGLPVQGPAGLGLTQIFAGTMDGSQMGAAAGPTQSMMPDFDNFPDSNFSATMNELVEEMVADSQIDTQKTTQGIKLNFSQSQMRGLDSLLRDESNTQLSEMIELSQDGGLQEHTPLKDRFIEPPFSTVETVMAGPDSPLVRRGRLRRRMETPQVVEETPEPTSAKEAETAFTVMKEGAQREKKRQVVQDFDRKKSKAKEMVEDQAEESEDEYAGLGGVDGEDSDDESIASVKEMIDDAAGNDLDEAKLAAFYADRERANDEKQVEKLFKDITTGMLRRKRGADYDLSDSDDGGEARRRMKRRQFAKMQKALFADERVKKIAENPGNQAFLRTIEDRGSDDEMDFLDALEEPAEESSESQSQDTPRPQVIPNSQPEKALGSASESRAPAHMRRTKSGRKPSNIGEVRETLSNLLDEPQGSVIPATEVGSDSEEEEEEEEEEEGGGGASQARSDKENQVPNARRNRVAVVDRISLKRNSSNASTTTTTRLAFAASSNSSFKVPALLRRATTNSLMSGSSTSSTTSQSTTAGGFGEESKIKKTAGKKSGINAFARDSERRARLQESERRREERKVKGAERRMGVVGGLLGKGAFE